MPSTDAKARHLARNIEQYPEEITAELIMESMSQSGERPGPLRVQKCYVSAYTTPSGEREFQILHVTNASVPHYHTCWAICGPGVDLYGRGIFACKADADAVCVRVQREIDALTADDWARLDAAADARAQAADTEFAAFKAAGSNY